MEKYYKIEQLEIEIKELKDTIKEKEKQIAYLIEECDRLIDLLGYTSYDEMPQTSKGTRKPDWELILYNKDGKVVLETNNYEDLIKFLGRDRATIYTFIYRAKRGLVRRVFDISGNAYTYDIKEF